ncbi:hypothetical protein ACJX0J_022611, partial [Zea mays]
KFKHIMRELQGAILVGSVFQIILGYTGLISLFMRLINPVVVALTIAAVGLAFFSYGFPQAGSCVEISMPFILLVLLCTLLADYTGMRYMIDNVNREHTHTRNNQNGQQEGFAAWGSRVSHLLLLL